MTCTHIAMVEDHALLAQTLGVALSAEGFDVTIADLASSETAVSTTTADERTLVLLDLDLGEAIGDGAALVPSFRKQGATVLVVSGVQDRIRVAAALEAGATGWVAKHAPFPELLDAVRAAARGHRVLDPALRHEMLKELWEHRAAQARARAPFELLTPRERTVLSELCRGKAVEVIAEDLVVSESTVRTQVRAILTKLEVHSQLAAVAKATSEGWPLSS